MLYVEAEISNSLLPPPEKCKTQIKNVLEISKLERNCKENCISPGGVSQGSGMQVNERVILQQMSCDLLKYSTGALKAS